MPPGYYIQVLVSLLIVAGIMIAVVRLSKSVAKRRYKGNLIVEDRLQLNSNVALVVVKAEGKRYMLSVGNNDMNVIKELDA